MAVRLEDLVEGKPPQVRETAKALCSLVEEEVPGVVKRVDRTGVRYRRGLGPHRSFVVVWPVKDRVNLLFPQGRHLEDPDRWLVGGGANRVLPVPDVEHVDLERVRAWVREAASRARPA